MRLNICALRLKIGALSLSKGTSRFVDQFHLNALTVCLESDFREVGNDRVGMQGFPRRRGDDGQGEAARGSGRLQSARSILDDQAMVRIYAEPARRLKEWLWMRLAMHDVIGGHQNSRRLKV